MPNKRKNSSSSVSPKSDNELQDMCAYRPKEGNMIDNIPCCASLHDKLAFKLTVFILVLALDAADLISDWLLYRDVSATEEGLVYGPTEDSLRYSLLAFSIIGSLTFTFEVVNLWREIFRNDPWIDVDLLSAVTVWIEDVPQITINVVIAACREEAISYFQLVKASVIIAGAVIRIIVSLVRYCNKRARQDLRCARVNKDSKRHVIYRAFIMTGLILTLGGAVTIFLFTQAERNADGSLNFKVPRNLIDGEYNDQRYFHNVSIYFSHKLLDYDAKQGSGDDVNLLRLLTINEIKKHSSDRTIKIQYDDLTNTKVAIHVSDKGFDECFQIFRPNKSLTVVANCSALATPHEFIVTFHYTKPSVPKLLFGDIKYNIKLKNGSSSVCTDPDFSIEDEVPDHANDRNVATLHYYRNKDEVSDEYHIKRDPTGKTGQFFHSNELQDISEVWKTGFAYCKSSGSLAPHRDDTIDVQC